MTAPWELIASAAVLVAVGALESWRSDALQQRGDLAEAWHAWLYSRLLAIVGVAFGVAGVSWELAR